jgi:hypothetical protein
MKPMHNPKQDMQPLHSDKQRLPSDMQPKFALVAFSLRNGRNPKVAEIKNCFVHYLKSELFSLTQSVFILNTRASDGKPLHIVRCLLASEIQNRKRFQFNPHWHTGEAGRLWIRRLPLDYSTQGEAMPPMETHANDFD